jgi:hypothetical protein
MPANLHLRVELLRDTVACSARQSEEGFDLDRQEKSILAYLLDGKASAGGDENREAVGPPERSRDDLDNILRNMGYSPAQREQLRRGEPRPKDASRYRDTNFKRFKWHLAQLLSGWTTDEITALARTWAAVTDYDLDVAQRWWAEGVDPAKPGELADAIAVGLRVRDLNEVIDRQTVAEHLQAGNSLKWCMLALDASKRRRRSA